MHSDGFSPAIKPVVVELELRFGTRTERLRGVLVGQRPPEYLIVEVSKKHDWNKVKPWFDECSNVVVRGVLEQGKIVAAVSSYLSSAARPQRLVFLTYPRRFETRGLREAPRLETELDAIIRPSAKHESVFSGANGIGELRGTIRDISRGGMGFKAPANDPLPLDKMNGAVVDVEIIDNGRPVFKTQCELRGVKTQGNMLNTGLVVDKNDKRYLAALDDLILRSKLIQQAFGR
ncbi:PilZ domain-containing protein [Aliidiomarina celeris]|uniref:PilZ domain-containing protein n=1 Tax=Aliidiomarina celeris TaxID=2249428 RepID=UPI00130081B7|nr:PilZ domain-containing protein [Aliidiomarina celeris]